MKSFDVIIVGAGPAGIFAALELTLKNKFKVLMIEKGQDIEERKCPARERTCVKCKTCAITSGWGGAGAFSDGKLTLSTEIGGWLDEYTSKKNLNSLIEYSDGIYLKFGAPTREHGTNTDVIAYYQRQAALADLRLVAGRVRHLGTERCAEVLKKMRVFLNEKVEIRTNSFVSDLTVKEGKITGVVMGDGKKIAADYVILAPGREGADWLAHQAGKNKLRLTSNAVDIGVRVEVPAPIMEPLTTALYESKLIYFSPSFQDKVRTFCMNPYGQVSTENYGDVITVNGHSYADRKTDNTNFALLVSTTFTQPFKEPIAYGQYIARLANLIGDGIIVQRLGDLIDGRRSTEERIARSTVTPTLIDATPGDLSFVLPYRYLISILEMLQALEKIVPGVNSRNTLLYGMEVKFYSSRLRLTQNLETEIKNLFAIGDGAGITRGLIQASSAGVIAARSIIKRLKKEAV